MEKNKDAEQVSVVNAEKWLSLIDAGAATESWNQTARPFKSAVSLEQWQTSLESAQVRLGKAVSRKLKSKLYTAEVPGAPDGEYAVIEYETSFEKKRSGVETVTQMKDADGEWRATGYLIRQGAAR